MNRRHFLALAATSAGVLAAETAPARALRVAIAGHTGKGNFGHGVDAVWKKVPGVEVVGVSDPDETGRGKPMALYKVEGFADYRAMFAKVKPDVVAICPRFLGEHHAMAMAAIEAGARGIYMEKPFVPTLAQADEIIAAAEQNGVKIAIAHRGRYNPELAAIDKVIKDGAIGRILELRARAKEDARGGAEDLWVLGSHILNLLAYFGGAPRACTGMLFQGERPATREDVRAGAEDIGPIAGNAVHACFEMERGFPAFFDSVQNAGDKAAGFGFQIIGTKGLIDFRMDNIPLAHLVPGSPFTPAKTPRPWIPITTAGPGEPEPLTGLKEDIMSHAVGARDLLAAIRENRPPLCCAQDGRLIVEMIFGVFASHLQNGARVTFPLAAKENPLA
ncbi:MAG: oxidoreductase domain protein [Verrucomicrobia bacterium]|nr:oxidoreductase domain protein [Verrucomicrobiota bacterium]